MIRKIIMPFSEGWRNNFAASATNDDHFYAKRVGPHILSAHFAINELSMINWSRGMYTSLVFHGLMR